MIQTRTGLSLILLILLGLVWSLGYSIARFCMTHGVPALAYSFWQSTGAAVLLGALLWIRKVPIALTQKHLRYYLVCALLGIAVPNSIMYFSAAHLPSGMIALLVNTVPLFTYLIALVTRHESFRASRLLAVLLGCLGIFLLIELKDPLLTLSSSSLPWMLITLITPLCFAACSVFIAKNTPSGSALLSLTFGMLACSSLFITPFMVATHSFYPFHFPITLTDLFLIVEIFLSALGYLLLFTLLRIAGAVYYSMVGGIVAIAGLFWGWLFFHESFSPLSYGCSAFIVAAIFLLSFRKSPR